MRNNPNPIVRLAASHRDIRTRAPERTGGQAMSNEASGLPAARFSLTAPSSGGPRMGRTLWELEVMPDDQRLWEAIPKAEADLLRKLVAAHVAKRRRIRDSDIPDDDDHLETWSSEAARRLAAIDEAFDALPAHWKGES